MSKYFLAAGLAAAFGLALVSSEKVKNAVDKVEELGKAAAEKQIQKMRSSITVVYDGKAPYISARNLSEYIKAMGLGCKVSLMDSDEYRKGSFYTTYGRVIILGHHTLAKEQLRWVGTRYDSYGMKFGFSGRQCVLKASRSALGRGKKGRREFAEYYDSRMRSYQGLADQYAIPMTFGSRSETRKSQYDLLWLEFAAYGLSEFLELSAPQSSENIAERAAANLVSQMEKDQDQTYRLDELLRNSYKQKQDQGIKTLRKHLGDSIVFTGLWENAAEKRELENSELLEGELSARIFTIGCYIIRSAERLYKDTDEIHYTKRVPAGQEEIDEYLEDAVGRMLLFSGDNRVRLVHEISAKYQADSSAALPEEWTYICSAADSMVWDESVNFIGTVKSNAAASDKQAALYVLITWMGDCRCVDSWFKLVPTGEVTEYSEDPYAPDSYERSWAGNE